MREAQEARKVVCSPVISMTRKSQPVRTAPRPGWSDFAHESSALMPPSLPEFVSIERGDKGADQPYARKRQVYGGLAPLCDVRLQQVVGERQGWSVFGEGTAAELIALTARMGAADGGVPGPYSWRQPV